MPSKSHDPEGSALLDWFADGAMTLLGYHVERPGQAPSGGLGIFSRPGDPTDDGGCGNAMRYFENGGEVPLLAKAELRSTVHRRVPLDLVVIPIREKGKVTGIGVHAGLWTSEALKLPPEEVPVLRARLKQLDDDFGFDPKGHSGKALRHAVASLAARLVDQPAVDSVRELVTMAMSLADRPRPALIQVRSRPQGPFVQLRLAPARRTDHRAAESPSPNCSKSSVGTPVTNWSVELGDGDLALIRYSQFVANDAPMPNAHELDDAVVEMVRGWAPAVESELIRKAGASRATRLALTYIASFPDEYRARTPAEEGAADILRLCALASDSDRDVRISRQRRWGQAPAAAQDLSPWRADGAQRSRSGAREFRPSGARGNPDDAGWRERLYPRFRSRGRATRPTCRFDPRAGSAKSSARSPMSCAARPRMTSSTSSSSTPGSKPRRWCGCAPGSATCARPAAASAC